MPLAKRVIPTLLCRGRQLVKGVAFDSWRSVGHAGQAVRIHQARGVDELVLLDIAATAEGRGPDLALVAELSAGCFMPLAVGGGVRTIQDVKDLLRAGADKVVICTAAQQLGALPDRQEWVLKSMAGAVGCQAIVASIDVKDGKVWTNGGKVLSDEQGAPGNAAMLAEMGAGEILLTSIEREGAMQGYDLDLIRAVSRAVTIPVIAHGGCGSYRDMLLAIQAGADAVAAGALFQFTDSTPARAAEYLAKHGVETRDPRPTAPQEHP